MEINEIQDYLILPFDTFSLNTLNEDIENLGAKKAIESYYKYADCTKIYPSGIRACQTIDYTYKFYISKIYYIIINYMNDNINEELSKLIDFHKHNIEFEKDNPPIVYKTKNKKGKTSKVKDLFEEDKPSRKELKIAKINKLTFNFKTINNGNGNDVQT